MFNERIFPCNGQINVRPEESRHSFRTKTFRKDRVCDVCQLPIDYQGNSCKNCKYVCHKECEMKPISTNKGFLIFDFSKSLRRESQGFVFHNFDYAVALFFCSSLRSDTPALLSLIQPPVIRKCETAEQSLRFLRAKVCISI
ncbi:hypothetical protein TNCT_676951 [Trichonephila clavata]|uniref:Phorbol-ester/DAG-type domain-containing protein n=1 Tax=Trichonephila clavata TaxID=2740835 RepID=A0A8X6L7P5_TRICU|nr:hypothetical protein TNCT_676951 [Trichonephila clavata]